MTEQSELKMGGVRLQNPFLFSVFCQGARPAVRPMKLSRYSAASRDRRETK